MKEPQRRDFLKLIGASAVVPGLVPGAATTAQPARPRIKIGQIGVGHAHASKLAVYRASADYEVVGIAEADAALRQQAEQHPAFRGLPWLRQEQLLAMPGLQVVLAETRVRDLLATAAACVAAGKHVHLDKPPGESLPQLRRLFTAAARQQLLVQMGYMYRYNPAVVLLREFLRQGWLGDVFEVHAVMSKVVPAAERRRLAEFRGGTMFELGCHVLDLVLGVLGRPREVIAFAQHSARVNDGLLDNMLAVLAYPRATATVRSSALEIDGGERRHLVVCGSEGTFHIQPLDNPSARVTLAQPRGRYARGYQDLRFPRYTRYVQDAADMASIIRGDKASDFTPEHDLAVQETLLRACNVPLGE
jgi:predicted dehydrogenase